MTLLIRNATTVYPCRERREEPLVDAWIRVDGPQISGLGPEPCPRTSHGDAAEVIDARGMVVIPGLINMHHHFFQSLTRAVPAGLYSYSLDWLRTMYPLWQELTPEAVDAASRLAAAELLLTGATTSVDFAYLFPDGLADLFDVELAAVRELGLRLHAVRGCMPHIEGPIAAGLRSVPGVDSIRLQETEPEILAACERAIGQHHDPARFSMCRIGVGPTAVPFQAPGLLRRLTRLAEESGGDRHLHLQPRPIEVEECLRLHGCRPTEFLRRIGWLGERSWLAHCTTHTAQDIEALAASGSGVAHCPSQNMRLGYPAGPIPRLREAGVLVGVGVDGASSSDSGSFLGELRNAHMIHRLDGVHPDYGPEKWLRAHDVLWMATRDSAAILGREDIGRLEPGCAADIVLIDLRQIGYAGGLHDPLSSLLFAGSTSIVDTSIVNGEVVVSGGRLRRVGHERVVEDANRAAAAMLQRAQRRTELSFGSMAPELLRLCHCG